jgi:uncharacterized protein Veg
MALAAEASQVCHRIELAMDFNRARQLKHPGFLAKVGLRSRCSIAHYVDHHEGESVAMARTSGAQRWSAWSALLAVFSLTAIVRADSWPPPMTQTFLSVDKAWR